MSGSFIFGPRVALKPSWVSSSGKLRCGCVTPRREENDMSHPQSAAVMSSGGLLYTSEPAWGDLATDSHVPRRVEVCKRAVDVLGALLALLITLPLWPLVALAIRLDSPGPVIYRQLRVGRMYPDRSELIVMMKFRSMRQDAEAACGPVWARKRDKRITRVGRFLRLTRLDELPQLINVLRGDMSLIGPRPERPQFYARLDAQAPFFADRTMGLRPGITGLAQVTQGYDTSISDVQRKVGLDAAYAMQLVTLRSWLAADSRIALQTLAVMATGKGQ